MTSKARVIIGTRWTSLSAACVAILQLSQLGILARLIDPEAFGLMAIVTVCIGFTRIYAEAGIQNAILHHQNIGPEQRSSVFWAGLLLSMAIFLALFLLAPAIGLLMGHPDQLPLMIRVTAFVLILQSAGFLPSAMFQKNLQFKVISFADIAGAVSSLAVSVLFALAGYGAFSLIWGTLAGAGTRSVIVVLPGFRRWPVNLRLRSSDLKGYIRFGLFQSGERTANFIAWNVDKLLIGSLLGTTALGFYNVAYGLMMMPLNLVNPIVTKVSVPVLAKIQDNDGQLRETYQQILKIISIIQFPIYAGLILYADRLLPLILGPDWGDAVPVFRTLAVLGFFYSLGNPMGGLLIAKGRVDIGFYFNLLGMVLYPAAILLAAQHGMVMVATSLILVVVIVLFPVGFLVRWHLIRMTPVHFVMAVVPAGVAAAAMSAAGFLTKEWFGGLGREIGLAGAVLFCAAIFIGVLALLQPREMARLLAFVRPSIR